MNSRPKFLPTGNNFISLPTIDSKTAALERVNFLSMKFNGLIELRGNEEKPFLAPFIKFNSDEVKIGLPEWERENYWIPKFTCSTKELKIQGMILPNLDERGFVYQFKLTNKSSTPANINAGIKLCWADTTLRIYSSKTIYGKKQIVKNKWFDGLVCEFVTNSPEFAFAVGLDKEKELNMDVLSDTVSKPENDKLEINLWADIKNLKPNQEETVNFCFGFGMEEFSAATMAKEMSRKTVEKIYSDTTQWLQKRTFISGNEHLDMLMNLNYFFNYFFATGITLDTEELVLVTSRSHRYYVSAAFWDRDSLLWSFPSILERDYGHAKKMLEYVFKKQICNTGVHSRYINGTVLEPGFELDELCAPVISLNRYIKKTKDIDFLKQDYIIEGMKHIMNVLETKKHPVLNLYETLLNPSDDFGKYPYLTYDNALVYRMLLDYSELLKLLKKQKIAKKYTAMAEELRKAILKSCIGEGPFGKMFYWAINLEGNRQFYDEPPGSLKLLSYYGFCSKNDAVYQNTVKWIHSEHNPYSFHKSPLSEAGCRHAAYPWVLGLCNSLLSKGAGKAIEILKKIDMDGGIACESFDGVTGESRTGEAFATCAGFLSYALNNYLKNKKRKIQDNAVVLGNRKARRNPT